jgi:hypothetical protein
LFRNKPAPGYLVGFNSNEIIAYSETESLKDFCFGSKVIGRYKADAELCIKDSVLY